MKGEKRVIMNKMRNRILELLSAGADDEEIRNELSVVIPSVSIKDLHQIRVHWNIKVAADREMIGSSEGLENAPPVSYQEIVEADERWNRRMQYWGNRRDFNMRNSTRVKNVISAEYERHRKERR